MLYSFINRFNIILHNAKVYRTTITILYLVHQLHYKNTSGGFYGDLTRKSTVGLAMFQHITNITIQGYAIIDITDFSQMSIISLMHYITDYCNILQCSTRGLSTQSKYASTILKVFNAVTHNTYVDDTQHHLNTLMQYWQ